MSVPLSPSSMTVPQLKKELAKRKISFRTAELKQYYVNLYRQGQTPPMDFSSDEEDLTARKSKRTASPARRRASLGRRPIADSSAKAIDVSSLSSAELRRELEKLGEAPGPVTDKTRSVYERQLLSLLEGGQKSTKGKSPARSKPTHSLPGTPRGEASRKMGMSDDEVDSPALFSTPMKSSAKTASRATPRRRLTEVERLKRMESPGRKSVLAMEPVLSAGGSAPMTRRSSLRQAADESGRKAQEAVVCQAKWSMARFGGLLVILLLAVFVFLLSKGYLGKLPALRH